MTEQTTTITLQTPSILTFSDAAATVTWTLTSLTQTLQEGTTKPILVAGPLGTSTLNLPPSVGFSSSTIKSGAPAAAAVTQSNTQFSPASSATSDTSVSTTPTSDFPHTTNPTPKTVSGSNRTSSSRTAQGQSSRPSNGTNPDRPHRHSKSVSPGAAAGIGVGCAVAGALIAAAIVALLFWRRRRRRPARSDVIALNGFGSVEKSVASPDPSSPEGAIERNLPQPAEDQALGGEMSRLRTSIKNHVQSYYHTNGVRGSVDQAALGIVAAGNMPLIASTLGSLLSNPSTRITAIRFCIAWVAISRIDYNCEPSRSFLPPEIASCLVSIAGAREDPSTRMAFMSRWRSITASLLQSKYGQGTFSSYDPRNQNISEALHALDSILSPFEMDERSNQERVQKLEEILRRGARFGFLLFSQPSTWDFDWNTPASAGKGALAMFPAFVQVGDDNGRRLARPRVLEKQELAQGLDSYL
ncbi:MAG: hypothetical protein LQ338_005854 [Usnochroma carphineum]|nr:MAG: hypothetical protein LQ338_005854 [Usnochroma carphineum]